MPIDTDLDDWCRRWLGAGAVELLFERRQLSAVVGVRLADGRAVVIKTRPYSARLVACAAAQRQFAARGFPCPALLAGPAPLGVLAATAEQLLPDDELLARGADTPARFAVALAWLVALAPEQLSSLAPAPPWVGWDHAEPGRWPTPDNLAADLNRLPGPAWLDEAADGVRGLLRASRLPPVVGHADWESQNLRWRAGRLTAVHDWDSLVAQPEAAIVGAAAAVFPADRSPLSDATIEESTAFLAAYERARGRLWAREELRAAWAAGLWVRLFNAKKAYARDPASMVVARLAREVTVRLRLAGL